jgi:UrcA family protein
MNSSTTINTAASGRKILLTLLAGSLIGSICAATAGAATADSDVPSVTVRYDDLNLSSEAGTRALYNRLVVAAKQVCPDDSSRQLATLQLVKVCREQAVINAARQIPSPQLAALVARAVKSG